MIRNRTSQKIPPLPSEKAIYKAAVLEKEVVDLITAYKREDTHYKSGIKKAIEAIQTGKMDPFPLFTHAFALEEINSALNHLKNKPANFIKGLVLNPPT